MTTRLRVLLAAVITASSLTIIPSVTVAECQPVPVTDDIRDYIGVAFTAKVVEEVSDETDPPLDDSPAFNWKVVLDVDRVYRGTVEETLRWHGYDLGCSGIRPAMLKAGQRLFISTDRLEPGQQEAPSHFTLMWTKDDDGWRFYPKGLKYGRADDWYPAKADDITSLRDIRRFVGALHRPYSEPMVSSGSVDEEDATVDNEVQEGGEEG